MSHFQPVALQHASRLLNHGPTILITSRLPETGERNVMAAAWSMPVEFVPPRVAIVVDKKTRTRELIEQSGMFAICIPLVAFREQTVAVGNVSGREGDKFDRYAIPDIRSPQLGLPVIEEGCAAWLECKLQPLSDAQQRFDTFFGEVISAAADARLFQQGRWQLQDAPADQQTLHHLGAGNFLTSGPLIAVNKPDQ
ncbi:flavin reductase family protein [Pantoea sp. 1.19]|uniref:flavin reductase family protein n=1 Tax=Pantoea sp. 1.19 TaxID=1925589 RepID=UPI000948D411|nr:flavin reductase family protein [Pantoea sp. 1.19]